MNPVLAYRSGERHEVGEQRRPQRPRVVDREAVDGVTLSKLAPHSEGILSHFH
jgi:hypothetical protein